MRIFLFILFALSPIGTVLAQDLTWQDANKQSAALFDAGNFAEAAPLAQQAATLYPTQSKAYKAENHAQLIWNAIDMSLRGEGQSATALFLETAIDGLAEKAGEKEILIAPLAAEAATMFRNKADLSKSDRFHRQACTIADEVLGETNPRSILYLMNWGHDVRSKYGAAWASGKIKTARKRAETHGEDNFLVLRADLLLAKIRLESGRQRTAVRKYRDLVGRLEKSEESDPILLQSSYAHLAYIYEELGEEKELDAVVSKLGQSFSGDKENILPLIRKEPIYPPNAGRLGREGYVIVEFDLDEFGRVVDPRVFESEGDKRFEKSALNAVKKWRYRPQIIDGQAQKLTDVKTQITFVLR